MNWNPLTWFRRPKRQRRFVLNVRQDIPLELLCEFLRRHTPIVSAREYAKLPVHLKALFVPVRKP